MNSDSIKIQFFSMLLYFHRKNEFFFSGVFQAFCEASLITAISQNSFQKHIQNPVEYLRWSFFAKIVKVNCFRKSTPSQMFDWVLNTSLFIDGYCYMALLISMYICLFQNVSKMEFQDHNAVQDYSFKELLSFKFKIAFSFWTQSIFMKWLPVA